MVKKSDILALLDRLPDEFEAEVFRSEFDALADAPVPQWQIDAAIKAAKEVRERGGLSEAEFNAEVSNWLASNS